MKHHITTRFGEQVQFSLPTVVHSIAKPQSAALLRGVAPSQVKRCRPARRDAFSLGGATPLHWAARCGQILSPFSKRITRRVCI